MEFDLSAKTTIAAFPFQLHAVLPSDAEASKPHIDLPPFGSAPLAL
jgi:hypothetical protein